MKNGAVTQGNKRGKKGTKRKKNGINLKRICINRTSSFRNCFKFRFVAVEILRQAGRYGEITLLF